MEVTPNDPYSGRTAPLTSKRCILYIYSTNTSTEYFKHVIYSPFFFSSKRSLFHNSNIFGSGFIHVLYTGCAKILKNDSGTRRLSLCVFFNASVIQFFIMLEYKFENLEPKGDVIITQSVVLLLKLSLVTNNISLSNLTATL